MELIIAYNEGKDGVQGACQDDLPAFHAGHVPMYRRKNSDVLICARLHGRTRCVRTERPLGEGHALMKRNVSFTGR